MFTPHDYQLLDFGQGRRLERFGQLRLDRPCPAVQRVAKRNPKAWRDVDARFERTGVDRGRWVSDRELVDHWTVAAGPLTLELRRTEFGHLGLFPEQAANWDWIDEHLTDAERPVRVLNLFAYTGGSTLAAAAAGAEVTHLDAARNTVRWARRNAELSGLADAPVRWIADDAMKFVRRELKRDVRYDAVILDPPSYGHGAQGEAWRLSKHLPGLLETLARLTAGRRRFILLTCHTPGFDVATLKTMLVDAIQTVDDRPGRVTGSDMTIRAATGRTLPSGVVVRWEARS